MEPSALTEKESETFIKAEEMPTSNPEEQASGEIEIVQNPAVEIVEDPEVVKARAKESVQHFKKALVDVWFLITPYLMSCRYVKPFAEDTVNFIEYVSRKLDAFSTKYETISDVKLLEIIELLRSFVKDALDFIDSDRSEEIVLKYLAHSHKLVLESLDYSEHILELMVPTQPGVKPLYELDGAENCIRKKCFCLLMNFNYRIIQKMTNYAEGLCCQLKLSLLFPEFLCGKVKVASNVVAAEE